MCRHRFQLPDELFRNELGTLKDQHSKAWLVVIVKPHSSFSKQPYAICGAIEQDLDRPESMRILEKISHTEWAAPVDPVPKS